MQDAQFEGQATQAFAPLTTQPALHAVQVEADVQVIQLAKQAVQVGAVPQYPADEHVAQVVVVVPVKVAHPVGKATHEVFI